MYKSSFPWLSPCVRARIPSFAIDTPHYYVVTSIDVIFTPYCASVRNYGVSDQAKGRTDPMRSEDTARAPTLGFEPQTSSRLSMRR